MNSTAKKGVFRATATSLLVLMAFAGESLAEAPSAFRPTPLAYIGPGAGLGAIGALLAVLGAMVLCVAGLVLYPLQVLRNRFRKQQGGGADNAAEVKPSA